MDGTSVPVSFYAGVTHKGKDLPLPQEPHGKSLSIYYVQHGNMTLPLPTLWETAFPLGPQTVPEAPFTLLFIDI